MEFEGVIELEVSREGDAIILRPRAQTGCLWQSNPRPTMIF